ncbi:Nuclear factor interleukin-3-regulated protein [Halotydeus destructor]|nr:Nuclear factor interleukin-3-regulated protein [Halotydeus destructor]
MESSMERMDIRAKRARWEVVSPVDLTMGPNGPLTSGHHSAMGHHFMGDPMSPGSAYSEMSPGPMTHGSSSSSGFGNSRKPREFIPDQKKDECYWDRRRRNNEAAKRSREKRRISDMVLETRVLELSRENAILRAELFAVKEKFGLPANQILIDPEAVNLPLPENSCRGRRNKLLSTIIGGTAVFAGGELPYNQAPSPLSSSSSVSDGHHSHPSLVSPAMTSGQQGAPVSSSPTSATGGNPSLPHKLRHKARNTPTDSDSERTEYPATGCGQDQSSHQAEPSADQPMAGDRVKGSSESPNVLKEENFTLRQELQRLASEVASLKNYLAPISSPYPSDQCPSRSVTDTDDHEHQDGDRQSTRSCSSSESGFSSEEGDRQKDTEL